MMIKLLRTCAVIAGIVLYGMWALGQSDTRAGYAPDAIVTAQPAVTIPKTLLTKPKPLASRPKLEHIYAWQSELGPRDDQKVYSALSQTPLSAQAIIDDLATQVTLSGANNERCQNPTASCASFRAIDEHITEFKLYLQPEHLSEPFVLLHEIGHAIDYAGISRASSQRFYSAFLMSPSWPKGGFYDNDGNQVNMQEVFADQFAIWVTGEDTALTSYGTVRLLSDAHFERLLLSLYDSQVSPLKT